MSDLVTLTQEALDERGILRIRCWQNGKMYEPDHILVPPEVKEHFLSNNYKEEGKEDE